VEEGLPEKGDVVHDMNGVYRVVTLWDEKPVCTLQDRGMAEAILLDLQEDRISEDEAERIATNGFSSFLYSMRVNFRRLFEFLG
jgi:hypothetical protein